MDSDIEVVEPDDQSEKAFTCTGTIRESHHDHIYGAAFNPYRLPEETPILATVGANIATIYEVPLPEHLSGRHPFQLICSFKDENSSEAFYTVAWSLDRKSSETLLCIGGKLGVIRLIDLTTQRFVRNLFGHGQSINEIRSHPKEDGIIASCSVDLTVMIWNVSESSHLIRIGGFRGHRNQILSLDWSLCGNYIVTASMDHSIKLWSLKGNAKRKIDKSLGKESENEPADFGNGFPIKEENMEKIALSYLEKKFAEQGFPENSSVEVQHPCATTNELHTNYIDCVRFCGPFIFSKGVDENFLYAWKFGKFDEGIAGLDHLVKADNVVSMLSSLRLDANTIWFAKFEIDNYKKWLLCGNTAGEVYIYNIRDHIMDGEPSQILKVFNESSVQVRQVCFEPYARMAAVAGDFGYMSRLDRVTHTNANLFGSVSSLINPLDKKRKKR